MSYRIEERYSYEPIKSRNLAYEMSEFTEANNLNFAQNSTFSSASSNSVKLEDQNAYYTFFVLAQIGGFYSFLRFIFEIFISFFSERLYIMNIINKIRANVKNNKVRIKPKKKNKRVIPSSEVLQVSNLFKFFYLNFMNTYYWKIFLVSHMMKFRKKLIFIFLLIIHFNSN